MEVDRTRSHVSGEQPSENLVTKPIELRSTSHSLRRLHGVETPNPLRQPTPTESQAPARLKASRIPQQSSQEGDRRLLAQQEQLRLLASHFLSLRMIRSCSTNTRSELEGPGARRLQQRVPRWILLIRFRNRLLDGFSLLNPRITSRSCLSSSGLRSPMISAALSRYCFKMSIRGLLLPHEKRRIAVKSAER